MTFLKNNKVPLNLNDPATMQEQYGLSPRKVDEVKNVEAQKAEKLRQYAIAEAKDKEEVFKNLDKLVKSDVQFKIFQATSQGSLCYLPRFEKYKNGIRWFTEAKFDSDCQLVFIYGVTNKQYVDGKILSSDLYPTGTYSYINPIGASRTIHGFATTKEIAYLVLKMKAEGN